MLPTLGLWMMLSTIETCDENLTHDYRLGNWTFVHVEPCFSFDNVAYLCQPPVIRRVDEKTEKCNKWRAANYNYTGWKKMSAKV